MTKFEKLIGALYFASNWVARQFVGLGRVIFLSRISLLIIFATSMLMILMPQGHEIGFTAADSPFWYFLPVIFCSLTCWLWVRVILNQEYGRLLDGGNTKTSPAGKEDKDHEGRADHVKQDKVRVWVEWVPRFVGVLPSLGATLAIWYANVLSNWQVKHLPLYLVLSICITIIVFGFVRYRRSIVEVLRDKLGAWFDTLVSPQSSSSGDFASMSVLMKISLGLGWVLPLLALLPGLLMPARIGLLVGASAAVFISATFMVSLLSTFVFAFNGAKQSQSERPRHTVSYDFPVVLAALFLSLIIPFVFDGNRFDIRKIDGTVDIASRPTLDGSISAWLEKHTADKPQGEKAEMVIVATAGGALRAALWTGSILGRLQDRVDNFDDKLFAISGVSGGSLGATAYMSALWEKQSGLTLDCVAAEPCFEARIQAGLAQDFLGPVMLGLVSNDVSLIGLGAFSKDRAEALEEAWEQAWLASRPEGENGTTELENPMARSFQKLWLNPKARSWPALLLNGTHQELGSRVVTSNLETAETFKEAYDFFALRPSPIATSTAVHNSARFSLISPSGKFAKNNHVIDGGYFENYGAETALEIVRAVRRLDAKNQ
ncbi:MAG: hypothetical protein AAF870_07745, partial [Pseudomonadota bacterium]